MAWLLVGGVLAALSLAAQTGQSISGSVLDWNGRALGGGRVYLIRTTKPLATMTPQPVAANGSFSLTGIPAGVYKVCASGNAENLSNCHFGELTGGSVTVGAAAVAGVTVRLQRGVRLVVELDDTGKLVDRGMAGVLIRLATATGQSQFLTRVRGRSRPTYETVAPADANIRLLMDTPGLELEDSDTRAVVSEAGHSVPLRLTGGSAERTVRFRVVRFR